MDKEYPKHIYKVHSSLEDLMVELIIAEKPAAAKRIADALADKSPKKVMNGKIPYYTLKHNKKDIIVVSAAGHLFSLKQKSGKSFEFPVFDVEWKPSGEVNKASAFSKRYLDTIKKVSRSADSYTVATDYDIEGEVIGTNVIRHALKIKDASRMKFSTLTKPDLIKAYENKSSTLDWGQANAGLTRHKLDWYYGINTSRALTQSIKSIGRFKLLSTGRVQGPALRIIVDREKEIREFKPTPYWQVRMHASAGASMIEAWHDKDKFWEKDEAESVIDKTAGMVARVSDIKKSSYKQSPPNPFDLTSLQIEAYRLFRISPKETLAIAQELYIAQLISYPRTSSQKLPKAIGYRKILTELSQNHEYAVLAKSLLAKKQLSPKEGKKTDDAHPAIYPTGIMPRSMSERNLRIYDLVVKRFLAVFSDPAVRETNTIKIDCNGELFNAKGTRTLEKGWHTFYHPYVRLEEEELPEVKKDQELDVKDIELLAKETQPPKRYTQASLISELEKKNLGTKATRAQIIDTLFKRGYLNGTSMEATDLGIQTCETLEKYVPEMTDVDLTRHFEEELEEIRKGRKKPDDVLEEAKSVLRKILDSFRKKETLIGTELQSANEKTDLKSRTVGKCPVCRQGNLIIKFGKFGRFIACERYPDCKATFKLPAAGMIKPTEELCDACGYPLIQVIKRRKKPQKVCINPDCSKKQASAGDSLKQEEGKTCPKCGKGKLILRKSIYGQFLGCSDYPDCKYTKALNNSRAD